MKKITAFLCTNATSWRSNREPPPSGCEVLTPSTEVVLGPGPRTTNGKQRSFRLISTCIELDASCVYGEDHTSLLHGLFVRETNFKVLHWDGVLGKVITGCESRRNFARHLRSTGNMTNVTSKFEALRPSFTCNAASLPTITMSACKRAACEWAEEFVVDFYHF